MDFRYNAYGIGQRRQPPNDAMPFAPIRSSGGSGGGLSAPLDDNFRGPQSSMSYGRSDSYSNNGFNNQRYPDIDNSSKYGSMQSNNFGVGGGVSSGGGRGGDGVSGYSSFTNKTNDRFGSNNNSVNNRSGLPPIKTNYDDYRGPIQQQQQPQNTPTSFLGRSLDQRFGMSENIRGNVASNANFMPQLSTNLSLTRSLSNLNNYSNKNNSNDNNQRFYNNSNNNNDRNIDTYDRRPDNYNDNYRGQASNLSNPISRSIDSSYKFNNERPSNTGNFGNYGNERGFNGDFRGTQSNDYAPNFDNNKINQDNLSNSNNNPNFYNNSQPSLGVSNTQNYRGQSNTGDALAVLETVNALMTNQSNWQVGNNNFGFGQSGPNSGGNRKWNPENPSAPKPNVPYVGAVQARPPRQQATNNNIGNKPQMPLPNVRKPPAVVNKFPVNRPQNQQQQKQQQQQQLPQKQNLNNQPNRMNTNKPQAAKQPVARNINGGNKPKPVQVPPKTNGPAVVSAPKTQAKPVTNTNNKPKKQPEVEKEAADAKAKAVGQKRVAETPVTPMTKADIKRRKLAIKRGFLIGGFKLPYIQNNKAKYPQPEDKSYAVMFFEQAPNYSTSGEELDDMEMADTEETDRENKNAGRTLVKRIRKRLHHEWTLMEEAKKYKSWQAWWTDYKWCEDAIKEQLKTYGSINLRNCFIPDLPRLTTEQVVDVIVQQGQFGLEKNSDNYYHNMKSIFTLMNITFLENLKMPNTEKVQEMIRAVPNDFWSYKMRSMVYLWAQYQKISKTSSPSSETGAKELQAIERDWKNPLFHWIAKQAFEELKAISEVEWPEHKELYANLESSAPAS